MLILATAVLCSSAVAAAPLREAFRQAFGQTPAGAPVAVGAESPPYGSVTDPREGAGSYDSTDVYGGAGAYDGAGSRSSCSGDGSGGTRIQLLYVRGEGRPDRLEQVRGRFLARAARADGPQARTSGATGERRKLRFVHGPRCLPIVIRVVVPRTCLRSERLLRDAVEAAGHTRRDRRYLLWTDHGAPGLRWGAPGNGRPHTSGTCVPTLDQRRENRR